MIKEEQANHHGAHRVHGEKKEFYNKKHGFLSAFRGKNHTVFSVVRRVFRISLEKRMQLLYKELTQKIIGLAIEVHRELGPGLLESTYQQCLAYELRKSNIDFLIEVNCPVIYKGITISCGYRIDLLVDDKVIVELKSVEALHPIYEAQLMTYMKLYNKPVGLLINFNVIQLKDGIRRFVL